MVSEIKNIAVHLSCSDSDNSCGDESSELCLHCMTNETIESLHKAYREQQRRGEMKRLFPSRDYMSEKVMQQLTDLTRISVKWFDAKCDIDYSYCS